MQESDEPKLFAPNEIFEKQRRDDAEWKAQTGDVLDGDFSLREMARFLGISARDGDDVESIAYIFLARVKNGR